VGKALKINITLPEEALSRIDRFSRAEKTTRSGLILRALQSYMQQREESLAQEKRRKQIDSASSEIRRLRAKPGDWDGVTEIRKWRESR